MNANMIYTYGALCHVAIAKNMYLEKMSGVDKDV